ncbi:hypothetical protein FHS43_000246 [Streptosporangium becharense]|uniref:Uncharacterized protein n=1 Tax=Streptosporangium becharense TaxID=1816182 RepID=A0A7W9IG12_9ACTN|nr:hypothetical protein [Streptosporangium becharense]MBB2909000.1 hypothetical protein [Streptosporangium becharense]MBB5819982.1 hypothetical protein [Streptosporangium becharense]
MEMSKQTAFALTLLVALSVVVPGSAGYLSAKMDAIERAHRELLSLENRLRRERLAAQAEEAERGRRDRQVVASARAPRDSSPGAREERKAGEEESGPPAFVPTELDPAERREARRREQRRREAELAERAAREERRWAELELGHLYPGHLPEDLTAARDVYGEIVVPEPDTIGSGRVPVRSGDPDLPEHPQAEAPTN